MKHEFVIEIIKDYGRGNRVIYKQAYTTERIAVEKLRKWYSELNFLDKQTVCDCSVYELGILEDEEIERLEEQMERQLGGMGVARIEVERLIKVVAGYDDIVLAAPEL